MADIEQRINNLNIALNEVLTYQPPSDLEILVKLIADKVEDELMSEMQRGE
jgi:hypothetical protein